MKPFAESCEQNRAPILEVLRIELSGKTRLLEIGSGTGQHARYFAEQMPGITWQPTDLAENLPGIESWRRGYTGDNLLAPRRLDVRAPGWGLDIPEVVFSANCLHIMAWPDVECLFAGVGEVLENGGVFCLYGPFNFHGDYTSESNARFDEWLKQRDPNSGIRDFEALQTLAEKAGMELKKDYAMPANNRTLVWLKNS